MYRLLSASSDTYITNKIIQNSGSVTSNVGQAGTLDLFKLFNEVSQVSGSAPVTELSRLLINFDLSPLMALTTSFLNTNSSSFQVLLNMKDIYGGQTVPSNYTVSLFPLAKSFDEGRGIDVIAFRDIDSANWLTSSIINGVVTTWASGGASMSGNLGSGGIDYYLSGNIGAGLQSLEVSQQFPRGDEDLLMDVTQLVSASMAGILPPYGWRLSFNFLQENDTVTRFVKRFSSRHIFNKTLEPRLIVRYDDSLKDDQRACFFEVTNNVFTYNKLNGAYRDFFSGSNDITGNNSLLLSLVASKSISITTSSFELNFSASITYNTTSVAYYSASFSASQATIGGIPQTGIYFAPVLLSLQADPNLSSFVGTNQKVGFQTYWQSLDRTVTYSTGSFLEFKQLMSDDSNVLEHNFVVNVTNLKNEYPQGEITRLRVFVQDYSTEQIDFKLPVQTRSNIYKNMSWRLVDAFHRTVIIPFDNPATVLSTDGEGMYFDLYIQDLDVNQVYELEFQITENNKNYFVTNQGFRFKVIP